MRLRPGFGGKDGEAVVDGKFPGAPGYFTETKWLAVPGFSNTEQNNRITVTIRKQGEVVQVFVDKVRIAEYEKAIPAAGVRCRVIRPAAAGRTQRSDVHQQDQDHEELTRRHLRAGLFFCSTNPSPAYPIDNRALCSSQSRARPL
ncbi:MAG: hypothetical protein ABIP55_16955 [Tepidisphaeraceae bacterium]